MPTYIDGISEPAKLFFRMPDGTYVPFSGIEQVTIIEESEQDPDFAIPSWTETGEMSFTATLTKQSGKRIKKLFRKYDNVAKRFIRRIRRKQEKLRREKLKNGGKIYE